MFSKLLSLPKKVRKFLLEMRNLKLIRSSDLFDEDWYLSHGPDVADAKIDPVKHYLYHGGFESRDPGPNFCSKAYLDDYLDVKKAHINPLVHYLVFGRRRVAESN